MFATTVRKRGIGLASVPIKLSMEEGSLPKLGGASGRWTRNPLTIFFEDKAVLSIVENDDGTWWIQFRSDPELFIYLEDTSDIPRNWLIGIVQTGRIRYIMIEGNVDPENA
jgi:hypothetical protein